MTGTVVSLPAGKHAAHQPADPSGQLELPILARIHGEPLRRIPNDLYIPPDALEVLLDAFEGPLDLLLYLIRKQNFDILDIPMAEVTNQYLAYVHEIRTRNLELAGSVTSQPHVDPNNAGFIYQRFQRVILHYDTGCGCTQPILLADYFKSILMGQALPPDLDEQARGSRFYAQYDNTAPTGVRRPDLLPGTDLRFTFEPQ